MMNVFPLLSRLEKVWLEGQNLIEIGKGWF